MKKIYFILLALCLAGCAKEEVSRELHSEADLAGLKVGVAASSIDLIIGGVYITEERQREMLFSSSYFSACTAYTVKDGTKASASFGSRIKEMVHNNLVVGLG